MGNQKVVSILEEPMMKSYDLQQEISTSLMIKIMDNMEKEIKMI